MLYIKQAENESLDNKDLTKILFIFSFIRYYALSLENFLSKIAVYEEMFKTIKFKKGKNDRRFNRLKFFCESEKYYQFEREIEDFLLKTYSNFIEPKNLEDYKLFNDFKNNVYINDRCEELLKRYNFIKEKGNFITDIFAYIKSFFSCS